MPIQLSKITNIYWCCCQDGTIILFGLVRKVTFLYNCTHTYLIPVHGTYCPYIFWYPYVRTNPMHLHELVPSVWGYLLYLPLHPINWTTQLFKKEKSSGPNLGIATFWCVCGRWSGTIGGLLWSKSNLLHSRTLAYRTPTPTIYALLSLSAALCHSLVPGFHVPLRLFSHVSLSSPLSLSRYVDWLSWIPTHLCLAVLLVSLYISALMFPHFFVDVCGFMLLCYS